MRRLLAGLGAAPLVLVALAGPADAAKPEVIHTSYASAYADAYWSSGDGDDYLEGGVHAAATSDGPELYLWEVRPDPEGGYVETSTNAQSGYSFSIDRGRLSSARLLASDLAVSTCTYDADGNLVGECVSGSVDVDLVWTGEGSTSRGGYTEHFKSDGFSVNVHVTTTTRAASIDGAITGTITADEFTEPMLGTYKQVETKRCTGDACTEPEG